MFRKQSELPFDSDSARLFLPMMVALMVFLATVILAGGLSLNAMLHRWNKDISGSLTVQITPSQIKDKDKAIEKTNQEMQTALIILRDTAGVLEARPLTDDELKNLLKPWLGDTDLLNDLPLPRMIDVTLKDGQYVDLDALADELAQHAPLASIDNHRLWLSKLIDLAYGLNVLIVSILGLVIAAASLTVVYATRTSMDVHKPIISLLHLMGAKDDYIARQYGKRTMWLGLIGGVAGVALAIPAIWGISLLGHRIEGGIISEAGLNAKDWLTLIFIPIYSGLLAMATTYVTVKKTLRSML